MLIKGELDFSEIEYCRTRRILWHANHYSFIAVISRLKHSQARLVSITSSFVGEEVLFDYYFELNDKSCIVRIISENLRIDSILPFFSEAALLEKEISANFKVVFTGNFDDD